MAKYIVLFLLSVSVPAMAATALSSARLFSHAVKERVTYEAIAGPIDYMIDEAGSEGYRSTQQVKVNGNLDRKVFDFPARFSAENTYEQLVTEKKALGYGFLFSCSNEQCGEVLGWKLYLDKRITGTEKYQYYALLEREDTSSRKSIIAIYVNEFSGQPRVLIDNVSDIKIEPAYTLLFDNGSSQLSTEQKALLDDAVISLGLKDRSLDLVGYSDDLGSAQYNLGLSRKRAVAVMEYLTSAAAIPAQKLHLRGLGEANPIDMHTTDEARKLNRRVEIRFSKGL